MYDYSKIKPSLFTEEGQVMFLKIRDRAQSLLNTAGAFRMDAILNSVSGGDTWSMMAGVDRMVELGEIREITPPEVVWAQNRIFVSARG